MVVIVVVVRERAPSTLVLLVGGHGKCHVLAEEFVHLAVRVFFNGLQQCQRGRMS